MKISVIIPAFNHGRYLRNALESVISQSFPAYEIILVDDASDDKTDNVIREFPQISIITNETNHGPSYCRNIGILASSGDLISFLDADDTWPVDKLAWQYKYLQDYPEVEIIAGYGKYYFEDGVEPGDPRREFLEGKSHFNAYLAAFLIRRNVFDRVGLFDESMRLSEDQDWFLRSREVGIKTKIVEKISLNKRIHPESTTHGLSFKNSGMIEALNKSIKRRETLGNLTNMDRIERDQKSE